jgi:simple sugar transport system ATP-binding protein
VLVLRHGKLVGEVATAETDRHALARLMVGAEVPQTDVAPATPGPVLMRLDDVHTVAEGNAQPLEGLSLDLRAGQITGLAGVSGNGQRALADLIGGLIAPSAGRLEIDGAAPDGWSPRRALGAGVARIPEDRHATGTIADFTLTENAILEGYHAAPFSRRGWIDWRRAEDSTRQVIADYDVRCPGPDTPIRLLSGGNMQKLILGRALGTGPRIILANQPVRGLDIGAVSYVQSCLIAARDAGAAVLLISEDLDEILTLADVIHVIYEGRLSPAFARGTMTPAELGVWMAGDGFGGTADAA